MRPDIVVLDREDRVVLTARVKAGLAEPRDFARFLSDSKAVEPAVRFAMFIDLETIYVFDAEAEDPSAPRLAIGAVDVFRHYAPNFEGERTPYGNIQILQSYFHTLVQAWLNDLGSHWKSDAPPAEPALREVGLMGRLEGGISREAALVGG